MTKMSEIYLSIFNSNGYDNLIICVHSRFCMRFLTNLSYFLKYCHSYDDDDEGNYFPKSNQ